MMKPSDLKTTHGFYSDGVTPWMRADRKSIAGTDINLSRHRRWSRRSMGGGAYRVTWRAWFNWDGGSIYGYRIEGRTIAEVKQQLIANGEALVGLFQSFTQGGNS